MIYLFDKQQNIVGLLKESDLTAGQINFKINTAIEFSFSVPINKGFNDDVKYVSTPHPKDKNKHLIFRLMSRADNVDSIEYTASELAYQELSSSAYIEDKRPNGVTAQQAMTIALDGSQWSLGTVNISGNVTTNFYYITNLEAIQKVVGLLGGEVYFYITITGNKISGRFMDYVFRQGNDTSKVFADGSNLLTVTKKQQSDSIYTAILPRGKGEQVSSGTDGSPDGYGRRIDISSVTWSKSSGKPLDKPAGSKILEDPDATAKYGHINGSARLYLATFDEIEDPNLLIQQAYQTLMSINHPLVEYSATVAKVGNLSLGDTVLIMHSERDLSYKTRVFEVKYDLLNPENTELSLGDNLSSNSITSQINQLSNSIATNSNQVQWTVSNGGHNNTSFGALEPTNPQKGDVWLKALPNGNTEEYYFDGTIWVLGAKTDQQWQENRAVAQGDNTTFYGTATPVGAVVGDVWFKNDNNEPDGKAMYTYSGTTWVKFTGAHDANRLTSGEINGTILRITNVNTSNLVGDIDGNLNKIKNVDTSSLVGDIDGNLNKIKNVDTVALIGGLDGTKNPLSNVPAVQLVGTMNKEVVNTISLNAEQITSGQLNSNIVNAIELNAGQITSGQLNSNIVNAIELNASQITAGQLNANIVGAIQLNAQQITSGQLNSNIVNAIELNARQITSGELNSNIVNAIKLNAGQITTGELNANIVSAMRFNASQIVAGQIDASIINVVNLNADNIKTGTIDASKINVMNISADNIVTGELSANFIKGGQLDFSQINGININADNIVSGSISGANLNINLNTGQVVFQNGRIYSSDLTTDINIDQGYISTANGNTRTILKNGQLQLISPNYYDLQTNPYLSIYNSPRAFDGTGQFNSAIFSARDRVIVGTKDGLDDMFWFGDRFYFGQSNFYGLSSGSATGAVTGKEIPTTVGGGKTGVAVVGGSTYTNIIGGNDSPSIIVGWSPDNVYSGNRVRIDSDYFHVGSIYSKTTSNGANVFIAPDGAFVRSSSSSKYKLDIEYEQQPDTANKLLTLDPATWHDKFESEQLDNFHKIGVNPERVIDMSNRRYYGIIAEDLVKAGLEHLVSRNVETGEVEGVEYSKIGLALIPIIRDLRNRLNDQYVEIERLKEKIK